MSNLIWIYTVCRYVLDFGIHPILQQWVYVQIKMKESISETRGWNDSGLNQNMVQHFIRRRVQGIHAGNTIVCYEPDSVKIELKIPRKYHNHEAQSSRDTKKKKR